MEDNTYTREELEQAVFNEAKDQLADQGVNLGYAEADSQYSASERLDEAVDKTLETFEDNGDIKQAGENDWGEQLYTIENADSLEDFAKLGAEQLSESDPIAKEEITEAYVSDRFDISDNVQDNFNASDIIDFKEGDMEVIRNDQDSPNTEFLSFGEDLAMLNNQYEQTDLDQGTIMTKEEAVEYGLNNGFDKEELAQATSEDLVEKVANNMENDSGSWGNDIADSINEGATQAAESLSQESSSEKAIEADQGGAEK